MKTLVLTPLFALFVISAEAASVNVLTAVLNSKYTSAIQDIRKVEVVATYRCPNCYDFVVSGLTPIGEAHVKLRTQQQIGGALTVQYLEGSK